MRFTLLEQVVEACYLCAQPVDERAKFSDETLFFRPDVLAHYASWEPAQQMRPRAIRPITEALATIAPNATSAAMTKITMAATSKMIETLARFTRPLSVSSRGRLVRQLSSADCRFPAESWRREYLGCLPGSRAETYGRPGRGVPDRCEGHKQRRVPLHRD
jgi:hypothetical protein